MEEFPARTWKGIWKQYRRNRMGMIGLAILTLFIAVATFAPLITPYDPIADKFIADSYAIPSWYRIFPQYRDFPPNEVFRVNPSLGPDDWTISTSGPLRVVGPGSTVNLTFDTPSEFAPISKAEFAHQIEYKWAPPLTFIIQFDAKVPQLVNTTYGLDISWRTPRGKTYLVWTSGFSLSKVEKSTVSLDSKGISFPLKLNMGLQWYSNVAEFIFSEKGVYTLLLTFSFQSQGASKASATFGPVTVSIPGRIHGILGTDHVGSDLFSQLVYGSRISLLIGVLASAIAVAIGLLVGMIAAFFGGWVDEGSMRLVDVLLVLPGLPLLFLFSSLFGRSIWNLILLIGLLSWPGFARVVRAQVLQLRTATFVEAAKAMGASRSRIILKHLIPNVLPLAYATAVLSIPGVIITEAALSFLALGDPTTPSWGRMFYSANAFGAFRELAWWWVLPPGIAITLLSLSFVFIGYALDEIINPRLRARR